MAVLASMQCRIPVARAICPALSVGRRWASDDHCHPCAQPDTPKSPYIKELKLGRPLPPMKLAQVFVSAWDNPDCCNEQCTIFRHDIKHLKKTDRVYTRTWNECEDFCREKWVCVGEVQPPEVEFRPRRNIVSKAGNPPCEGNEKRLGLMKCKKSLDLTLPCPKIKMPGCKPIKPVIMCEKGRPPACCQKRCTLYPSYSECKKPKPKVEKPNECSCFRVPSMCEVYAAYRKYKVK